MKPFPTAIAGLAGLASLGAHAQAPFPIAVPNSDPVVVTAARGITPAPTLRDATVISREDIEAAGPISLGELLQRRAGIELRAVGGAGQPQTLFIRGAGTAQTLVLVDGMRVGSATVGTTAIEHIPLEMIERIEVVKGPLSSVYGPEAIGGVVQVFTRGKAKPHLFITGGYGSDDDRRISTGIATEDGNLRLALNAGYRQVQAPSASNPRNTFGYNPDDDPHRNAFGNLRLAYRLWQGETVEFETFTTQSRTHFDAGPGNDRNDHAISGMKLSSSNQITSWWASRISGGQGRDRLELVGSFPGFIETRQDQATWLNELASPYAKVQVGVETVRQKVLSDDNTPFSVTRRDTDSAWLGMNEAYAGHRFEGSIRRDKDEQFGARNTGAASYGLEFPWAIASATYAQGFRAPTFFDLYGPAFPGANPNPALRPEESTSKELSLRSTAKSPLRWRVSGFDHRFENLIAFSAADEMPVNVARARARGIELEGEMMWYGVRLRGNFIAQEARNDDTGSRLQGRADRYGAADASRSFGAWTVSTSVVASGPRYDSTNEAPASRLPGYAVIDARVKYAFARFWTAELAATNITDKRYENAVGYDAPRRGVFLQVSFQAF